MTNQPSKTMSRATRRHATKKAEDMSSAELKSEIERIDEKIPTMPTHEFDDKRAIHKKRTRQEVYREELESREDAVVVGNEVFTADEVAEMLAPYGNTDNGLRASKPSDENGLIQFVWRMARFHSGADTHMPMTCYFDLSRYLKDKGIDASVSGIIDDEGEEILDNLQDLVSEVCKIYGLNDTRAATRWKKAGLF